MDPRNGHVETIGALGARKRQIVTILQSLNEQWEAAVTIHEKSRIRAESRSKVQMLHAVNLKIKEYDEQRAIEMYLNLKVYFPIKSPSMDPKFPKTFEALQTTRKRLWDLLISLYPQFEVAPTMMEKSALISDIRTGMLMLGSVMHKIKEYDGTATAADWYRNAAIRHQQEVNMAVSAICLSELPAVAAPANFSAPASLPNGHLSPTSSDVEPEPERSVDTNVRSDVITLPPRAGDTATTSLNTGTNGAPANASAPAPLPNGHPSTTSSDVEPEPEGPVDTNIQLDLTTLLPPASEPESEDSVDTNIQLDLTTPFPLASEPEPEDSVDTNGSLDLIALPAPAGATATTSHNTGMNGALGARINRMLGSLARLAEVVRNA